MSINKEDFKKVCERNKDIPVFLSYNWYNDYFSLKNWDVILEKRGDEVVGFLPFIREVKKGFKVILPQTYSPYQGIWIKNQPAQKNPTSISYQNEIINALIEKLPKFDYFEQKFYPSFSNWLPFHWKNFKQSSYYTYIIDDISNPDKVFENFTGNTRRIVRKAEKEVFVSRHFDINDLYVLKKKSAAGKKKKFSVTLPTMKRLYDFCEKYETGELLVAKDAVGNIHAGLLYIWDDLSAYYLIGGTNPEFKNSGAITLLLWEAIKRSSMRTKEFNFEGSMMPSIERYFRGFGGKLVTYHVIKKNNSNLLKFLRFYD